MAQGFTQYQQPGQGHGGGPPQPPPPPPKRKYPYRDGISQSQQYYDLYEMIRRPNIRKEIRPPDPPPRRDEKPKSKQKQLESFVGKKFEEGRRQEAGSRFGFLAMVVKFMFLLFVFPPYFTLYVVPKWFFFQMIPRKLKQVNDAINAFEKRVQARISRFFHSIVIPFKRVWKLIKAESREQKAVDEEDEEEYLGFFAFIAEGILIFYRAVVHPMIIAVRWSVRSGIKLIKQLRTLPGKMRLYMVSQVLKIVRVKEKVKSILMGWIVRSWQRVCDKIDRTFVEPVRKWIRAKVEFFKKVVKGVIFLCMAPLAIIKFVRGFIASPTTAIRKLVQSVQQGVNALGQAVKEKVVQWYRRKLEGIYAVANRIKDRLDEIFLRPLRKMKAFVVGILQVVHRLAPILAVLRRWTPFKFNLPIKRFSLPSMRGFSFKLPAFQLRMLSQAGEVMMRPLYSLGRTIKASVVSGIVFIQAGLKGILELIKMPFAPVFAMHRKAKAIMQKVRNSLWNAKNNIVLMLRLIMAWNAVLVRYGMKLVRETASNFNFMQRNNGRNGLE